MQITEEDRRIAAGIAAAHPLERGKAGRIARGNHLVAANDEAELRYIRQPQDDVRVSRGDAVNANAWLDTESGRTRMFCTGYDANAGKWLALDDAQGRARVDGSAA